MWTLITDCGKQLIPHAKLRETIENRINIYEITEVEFDQYKLELLIENDHTPAEPVSLVFKCNQLIQYHFEVEA